MELNTSELVSQFPLLTTEITLNSLSRRALVDSLIEFFTQVIQDSEIPPQVLQVTGLEEGPQIGSFESRQQFQELQQQLAQAILANPKLMEVQKATSGNTIPGYIRDIVRQSFEQAVKVLIEA